MEPQNFQLGKAVFLQWEDSAEPEQGWVRLGDAHVDIGKMNTYGLVVGCDDDGIAVSTTITDQGACITPLSIPWGCVKNIREIAETKSPVDGSNPSKVEQCNFFIGAACQSGSLDGSPSR